MTSKKSLKTRVGLFCFKKIMSEQVFGGTLKSEEFGNSNGNHEDLEIFVLLALHLEILPTFL